MIIKKLFEFPKSYSRKQRYIFALIFMSLLNFCYMNVKKINASYDIEVTIYVNNCFSCSSNYVEDIMEMLKDINVTNTRIEYLNDSIKSKEILNQLKNNINLSEDLSSNIILCINKSFLFEGNISKEIIKEFILNYMNNFQHIWIYYDDNKNIYKVMKQEGIIVECNITKSITDCLNLNEKMGDYSNTNQIIDFERYYIYFILIFLILALTMFSRPLIEGLRLILPTEFPIV